MRVEVTIPSILRDCVPPGDRTRFAIDGVETLAQALRGCGSSIRCSARTSDDAGQDPPARADLPNDQESAG